MRSEITQRIIDETPERVKDEVKEYAKNRIRMNDKERKIHVLEMVLELCWPRLLPEELADLRSLMEDLKGEHNDNDVFVQDDEFGDGHWEDKEVFANGRVAAYKERLKDKVKSELVDSEYSRFLTIIDDTF